MEGKNNQLKIFLIIFIVLSILLGGFIIYDKVLKKEKEKEYPECEKCNNSSSESTCLGENVNSVKEISITDKNQTIKIGNKEYNVRHDSKYHLLLDDNIAYNYSGDEISVDHGHIYLTDKFMFATIEGQIEESIVYAINENGEPYGEIIVNNNGLQMKDFKINNGYLHATGAFVSYNEKVKDLDVEYKDVIIKYIDNTLIVTENK